MSEVDNIVKWITMRYVRSKSENRYEISKLAGHRMVNVTPYCNWVFSDGSHSYMPILPLNENTIGYLWSSTLKLKCFTLGNSSHSY